MAGLIDNGGTTGLCFGQGFQYQHEIGSAGLIITPDETGSGFVLMENSGYVLMEDGSKILLE